MKKNYKYFIGYWYNDPKVKPWYVVLPKTSAYVKNYDGQTKGVFLIENDDFLEQCNTIWDKVNSDLKNEFDSKPICNKEFLKTKMKFHGDEVTDFYDKEIPKVDTNQTCLYFLALISLDHQER